jgi:hypothetical protein
MAAQSSRQVRFDQLLHSGSPNAVTRAAKRARTVARQYGTSIHVQSNGAVVALKP